MTEENSFELLNKALLDVSNKLTEMIEERKKVMPSQDKMKTHFIDLIRCVGKNHGDKARLEMADMLMSKAEKKEDSARRCPKCGQKLIN